MNAFFSVELLAGTFVGLLLAMLVLLVLQVRTTSQVNKLTFPAYEYVIKKAEHDAHLLIQEAQQKADTIIVDAKKAGHATIREYTNQATQIHEEYKDAVARQTAHIGATLHEVSDAQTIALQNLTGAAASMIASQQQEVVAHVKKTNTALAAASADVEKEVLEVARALHARITGVGESIETQLREVDTLGKAQLATHLASLQTAADEHIAVYQDARMKLLDAHVEQLVESVVVQVLHTQLPVAEHASLARTALEEAKAMHIL